MKTHYYTSEIIKACDCKHLTVEDIYEKILQKFPDAGRSSIYRNVEELVKTKDLKKIIGVGKKAYFEKNIGKHIHLIDNETGKIIDLEKKVSIPKLPKDFKISDIDIKIFGKFI